MMLHQVPMNLFSGATVAMVIHGTLGQVPVAHLQVIAALQHLDKDLVWPCLGARFGSWKGAQAILGTHQGHPKMGRF